MNYEKALKEKLKFILDNVFENISVLSSSRVDKTDFTSFSEKVDEINNNTKIAKKILKIHASWICEMPDMDDDILAQNSIEDYADMFGYSIGEIAGDLGKTTGEIDFDDIDNCVGN